MDGFCSMPYGDITLTFAVPEEEAFFVLYTPLMPVSGVNEKILSRFFQQLLAFQLRGDLLPW